MNLGRFTPPPKHIEDFNTTWKKWINQFYEWVTNNMNRDFFFEVRRGSVLGHKAVSVTAQSEVVSSTTNYVTIWERNAEYTFTPNASGANIDQIVSDNAGDTSTSIVYIEGLDANWEEVTQTVQLNGTTPVTLSTPLFRVNSATVIGEAIVGTVTIYINGGSTATDADVRAEIHAEHQRAMTAIYSVPTGKSAYVVYGKTSVSDNKSMHLHFDFGYGDAEGPWITSHAIFLFQDNYDYFFKVPGKIAEKTDIRVQALKGSGGGAGALGTLGCLDSISIPVISTDLPPWLVSRVRISVITGICKPAPEIIATPIGKRCISLYV